MKRLILLDRDGTVIVNKHYLSDPEEVQLIPGAAEGIRALNGAGHTVCIVSNQSGVARGMFTVEQMGQVMARMIALLMVEGAHIDRIYTCPEVEDSMPCRKPNTGMLEQASSEFELPLDKAVIIGDNAADVEAGRRAGCKTVLVRTGYGTEVEHGGEVKPDVVVDDLKEASEWVLELDE